MKKGICFLLTFCMCCNIFATTYFVSSSGNNNNDGLSWTTAKQTIQAAINIASVGDSVFVAVGNYAGFQAVNGVHVFGGFVGTELYLYERQSLTYGYLSNGLCTKIDQTRNMYINGYKDIKIYVPYSQSINTCIDGFVLSGSNRSYYSICLSGHCSLKNCYISENPTEHYVILFTNTKGNNFSFENIQFEKCNGYALYAQSVGTLQVSNCIFKDNENRAIIASHGTDPSVSTTIVNITNCSFINNKNNSSIISCATGVMNITNSRIMNNMILGQETPRYTTRLINVSSQSILRMRNCLLVNNSVKNNYTTNNNNAGVCIIFDTNAANLILQNCTFANNKLEHVNANTKLAGVAYINTNNLTYYNNIYYDTTSCYHTANYTFYNARKLKSFSGVGNIVLDTLNNGHDSTKNYVRFVRPTTFAGAATNAADSLAIFQADWHLSAGSACIDAGYPYYNTLTYQDSTDLDGNHRVSGGRVDMGAYEYPQADAPQQIVWNQNLQGHLSEGWLLSEASATSGLPLSYTSSNPGVATISGDTFVFHAVGKTTITATQWGDSVYMPATPLAKLLTVYGDTIFEQDTVKYYDTVWHNDTIWHHDTIRTQINDTVWYNDTIRTQVYDTLWHNDTLWVNDTLWYKDTLWYHDTTRTHIYDTIWHNDTTWYNDTIRTYINDTLWHNDTLWTRLYDTIPIYDTVTIYVYDTITVYDTVRVNIQDIDISVVPWQITQDGESIYVSGAEGESVRVYDVTGRCLHVEERAVGLLRFRMYASGVYLVQIGNNPAQKVVLTR